MVQRKREAGSGEAQHCQKAEILFRYGICTVSVDGGVLIAPLMRVLPYRCEHTHLAPYISPLPLKSPTGGEEGDKCAVIAVKANKIRPNLFTPPYGEKKSPDIARRNGRGQMCLKVCTCVVL